MSRSRISAALVVALAALLCRPGTANAASLQVGNVEAPAEAEAVTVPLILTASPNENVAGVQTDLRFDPAVFSVSSVVIGKSGTAAEKSINTHLVEPGVLRVIVAGMNLNTLTSGEVAELTFTVGEGAREGRYPLALARTLMSSPLGRPVSSKAVDGSVVIGQAAEEPVEEASGCSGEGALEWPAGPAAFLTDVGLFAVVILVLLRSGKEARCAQ